MTSVHTAEMFVEMAFRTAQHVAHRRPAQQGDVKPPIVRAKLLVRKGKAIAGSRSAEPWQVCLARRDGRRLRRVPCNVQHRRKPLVLHRLLLAPQSKLYRHLQHLIGMCTRYCHRHTDKTQL
jgi:hypothetical protein